MKTDSQKQGLRRELGLFGATMMGLGSIIGTGIFVSVGVAAGRAGPSVILAIVLAALVAVCNAFSSAQLAASHPVSGGTYEYGYRYLHPCLGFTAGWMFLCAKTASAATAALGFAGYLMHLLHVDSIPLIPIAAITSILLTILVLGGLKQTHWTNSLIVSVTFIVLLLFVIVGLSTLSDIGLNNLQPFFPSEKGLSEFFYATALMFVAYTGYGRVATLGEEVKNPKTIIPRAIIATLVVSALLYTAVSLVAVGTVGADHLAQWTHGSATPLERVARTMEIPGLGTLIALGACTSMLGVLLNLILGLSRVALAMGRQGDLPVVFARLSAAGVPRASVIGVGMLVTGLVFVGSVETTWAFSALTVLIYYSITNLAALRLPKEERLYHPVFAVGGLLACLFLAFWIPLSLWMMGLGLLIGGLVWHFINRLVRQSG
ncbi:amino acid permease [Legionella taurinensis]|uniref:Amino acid permease n=1 Tax=Legionella taurinensis TaxID=70611 RepID=A0A3A5LBD7_9GAMM|nr:APC family permease [Legionella taurinensis]MDX1838550.1 APC family permease [Legionella taurinensis]PUT38996.1 amino acid permease [Legionella taurinensis]PUT41083.1 amino acid permease [Legionella taurinensis]PUT43458.1 amino acid permease [Legionella taurinensis]PUT46475.1 amino acid permease [Legionella taurinensis]